tara:strand:- start:155 stop:718 length:564 start_codon:yes stop_codon:yes gene_type:complete
MLFKSKSRKKRKYIKKKDSLLDSINYPIILLTIISIFFIGSFIYELKYNESKTHNINLEELLNKQSNLYEKKTGHKIVVEVLNGCGQGKIASMYQNFLRSEGFDVMDAKNALTTTGAYDYSHKKTKIQIHRGEMEMAYFLSNLMGINDSLIIIKDDETLMIDISLIIGKDFQDLSSYDAVARHYSRY